MAQDFTLLPKLRIDTVPVANRKPTDLYPLALVVTIRRQRYPLPLGRKLTVAEWDETARRARGRQAAVINSIIIRKTAEVAAVLEEMLRKNGQITMSEFRSALEIKPLQRLDIKAYLEEQMLGDKAFQAKRTGSTLKRIKQGFDLIYKYMPAGVAFEDVKAAHLVTYFDAMLRAGTKNNTALKSMTILRQIYNHARERDIVKHNPFTEYRTPAYERVQKPYLTLEQCDLLLDTLMTATKVEEPYVTLGFYLLECFSGLRQSDWNSWKIDKGEKGKSYLRLRMSKKTGEPVRLPLHSSPRLEKVVNWIIANFPDHKYPHTQQHANRTLRKFMGAIGLDAKIRTHSGRHTCATLLLDKGFSREAVAEVLGVTVEVVDTYAKLTRHKVQMEFDRHGGL